MHMNAAVGRSILGVNVQIFATATKQNATFFVFVCDLTGVGDFKKKRCMCESYDVRI